MIRDLVEISIDMVREEKLEEVTDKAEQQAEERLLDLLLPATPAPAASTAGFAIVTEEGDSASRTRKNCAASCVKASWMNVSLNWSA